MQVEIMVDQSSTPPGTNIVRQNFGALVTASSCLVTGGLPALSGTLTLTQPATSAIYNSGATAQHIDAASQALVFTASRDTYVDFVIGSPGTYAQPAVTNGSGAPILTANSVRLYKAVSNGSQVTSITQLASSQALTAADIQFADETATLDTLTPTSSLQNTIHRIFQKLGSVATNPAQTQVQVDATEAATADSLGGGSLLSNMDRIRYAVATALGLTWAQCMSNTKAVILKDGTNSASPTFSGAVVITNGLTVNASGLLVSGGGLTVSAGGAAITGASSVTGALTLTGHVITAGGSPTPSNLTYGTGTPTLIGTDTAGTVLFTLLTQSYVAGTPYPIGRISYASAYGAGGPKSIVLTWVGTVALVGYGNITVVVNSPTSSFDIYFVPIVTTPSSAYAIQCYYHITG